LIFIFEGGIKVDYFRNLRINRLIIHQIFKRNHDGQIQDPRYSNELTQLGTDGIRMLQERLSDALGDNSHSQEMDIKTEDNESFQLFTELIGQSDEDFIETTKTLTYRLAQSQNTKNIPGGVIIFITGTTGVHNRRYSAVIKAELHDGFSFEKEPDGPAILKYLSDLMMTPQQQLYKIGVFLRINNNQRISPADFTAVIYDHSLTKREDRPAALYFYNTFLDCQIRKTDDRLTLLFYNKTNEFINTTLELTDEKKYDLKTSLYVYMKNSNDTQISVDRFADEFMTREDKDHYISFMRMIDFPLRAINKDLNILAPKLKKRRLKFSNNISLSGPSEHFEHMVRLNSYNTEIDETTLVIQGKLQEQF
jgi:hypothetical protein